MMKKFYIFLVALVAVSLQAYATGNNHTVALNAKIDSLELRLAKMEKRATAWDKIKRHFKVSGFIQASYTWNDDVKNVTTPEGVSIVSGASTFNVRRARVMLSGDIVKDTKAGSADYRLQVDFAGSPKIVDAWVRYRPFNGLGLQIGQFKSPLSIENLEFSPPARLEFIENALIVQRFVHASSSDVTGISSSGRDIGAQLYGGFFKNESEGFNHITYNVAVFNGAGINKKDDNKSKDIVARVMVYPIKDLAIACYYQWGASSVSKINTIWSPTDVGSEVDLKHLPIQRYGGGMAYVSEGLFVRSEYLRAKTGPLTSDGAYALAGYRFKKGYLLGARFEYFDEDCYKKGCQFNYTLGASYQPWKQLMLQLNYTLSQYHNLGHKCGNTVALMVTGIF